MLISTCLFCSRSIRSGFSGMASQSTPTSRRGEQHPAKAREDIKRDNPVHIDGWANELNGRVLQFGEDADEFIDTLLPCSTPYELEDDLDGVFADYRPKKGKAERESYPALVEGLRTIVEPLNSKTEKRNRTPLVVDTSEDRHNFPFNAFVKHHHHTRPDISFSFPGEKTFIRGSWQHISMVVEAKGHEEDDPFPRKGLKNVRTVEQLAKNARNLMLAHGFLCSFVVGIYGHIVRLVRFDHTCALVSKAFDLRESGSAKILQRFLWHFVHPRIGDTVVGCDPTVSKLDKASQEWVKKQLEKGGTVGWEKHVGELDKGRRVEVYDEKTGRCIPYVLYHLVDVNGRLFSRATMVWRALEDTRVWKGGRLIDDGHCPKAPKAQILKEAWRQLVRTAEATFYDRINGRISDEERYGVPKMACGGDIGEFELRWWEETGKRWERRKPASSRESASRPPTKRSKKPSTSSPPLLFSSIGSAESPSVGDEAESSHRYIPKEDFPFDYPQHQTYSWRLAQGTKEWHRERSHMRIVIDDVGRPLTEFTCTHELVVAVRDAIIGHRLLWEKANILHRDVSVGNILIKGEKKLDDKFTGFLHDFDYSSMVPDPETVVDASTSTQASVDDLGADVPGAPVPSSVDPSSQKERTGTYYFMAIEILKVPDSIHNIHHDLESFYWVLLWVIVRHTNHGQGEDICNDIFKYGNDKDSASAKRDWLESIMLEIPDNKPLSYLLKELTVLVLEHIPTTRRNAKPTLLTYEAVLEIFDTALAMPGWPEKDWRPCTLLDGDVRTGIAATVMTAAPEILDSRPIRALPTRRAASVSDALAHLKNNAFPPHPSRPHLRAPFTGPVTQKMLKRPAECLDEGSLEKTAASLRSDASQMNKRRKIGDMGPPTLPHGASAESQEATETTEARTGRPTSRGQQEKPPSKRGTRSSSRVREQMARKAT
ncbi:hypothetical protein C8Q79DRAFT_918222 [Trametes meyenii]|nr:hypothetical protein C8Q79DRAFT_918222 [Trametes meyenii]